MTHKKDSIQCFLSNVLKIFNFKIIIYLISLVSSVYIARILEPAGKGELAIVTTIFGVGIQLGNLGIHSANTYYTSKNKREMGKCVGNSIIIVSIVSVVCFIIYCVLFLCQDILKISHFLLTIAFLLIPINLFNMLLENHFLAGEEIYKYNLVSIIENVSPFILLLLASFVVAPNVNVVVFTMLMGALCVVVCGFLLLKRTFSLKVKISWDYFTHVMPFGIKSYISCLMAYLVLKSDIFMLNYYVDQTQIGLYSLASNLGEMFFLISSSVSLILFPKLSIIKERNEKNNFIKKVCRIMVPLMIVSVIVVFVVADYAVVLLYGIAYRKSAELLRILLPGILFWSTSQYFYSYFSSENKFLPTIIMPMVGFIANIGLNYVWIRECGAIGAAYASTISYGVCCIGMILWFAMYVRKDKIE